MKVHGRKSYKPGKKDECASPPYSVIPLLEHIEQHRNSLGISRQDYMIWEPFTGMYDKRHYGLIEGFEAAGYSVYYRHKVDFLDIDFETANNHCLQSTGKKIRAILSNPPFSKALKRRIIAKCNNIFGEWGIPFGLLMNTTTFNEYENGRALETCSMHTFFGRVNFGMPDKGWGTRENPTQATFTTNWFVKGLADPYAIYYSRFDVRKHFVAMDNFYNDFIPFWQRLEDGC